MSILTASRDATLRQRDLMRHKRRANRELDRVFSPGTGFTGTSQLDRNNYVTELAYSHNRGEPYAATRPIAQRIAGQPIHVAEVVNATEDGVGEKRFRAPKPGRRRLTPKEMFRLPAWVKDRLKLPMSKDEGEFALMLKSHHSAAVRVDILEKHPVLELLQRPNPRMNGHTLMEVAITSLMFTGKCFWWLTKGDKRPFDLWYIPAHRVQEKPDNVMLDKGYLVVPADSTGGTINSEGIPIPAARMIYFYHPDPSDPIAALAPIRAIMQNVRVGEAINYSQEQTFSNGLFPALAFIMGDIIAPDGKSMGKAQLERWQLNEIDTRLKQLYQGPMKHGKHIVLDRTIADVKPITNKPNEMDWMNSASFNRDCIWRGVGTPRVIAGDIQDANRATALVADESFIGNSVNPRVTLVSQTLNDQLLPLYEDGRDLIMWVEDAVSADRDAKMKELELLLKTRGMTVDEFRAELGYAPLPNNMGAVLVSAAMDVYEPIDPESSEMLEYREGLLDQGEEEDVGGGEIGNSESQDSSTEGTETYDPDEDAA